MLYRKNQTAKLPDELFANPTSEYRGAPFWAWNCALDKDEMTRQIGILQEMGFGGFHMHVRTGLETPYLSEEFMDHIAHCVNDAEKQNMLAWLYDEDRWPSGAAGGLVTKEERFRARHLTFTPYSYEENDAKYTGVGGSTAAAKRTGNGKLLACYDVELNADGSLKAYRQVAKDAAIHGTRWYAYLEVDTPSGWYNNQTYVNTLDKKAMDRFIEITYEAYQRRIGSKFGTVAPAFFTDEPQFSHKTPLKFVRSLEDVFLPWTDDLADTFRESYGEDLMAHLPELVWDLPEGRASVIRYYYHDHVCERFVQAFADNCGNWCRTHGLKLTGHMMEEVDLCRQTAALGEAMRSYRSFDQPGIDMLCAWFEYTTAKQAQSAVHQYGYEGMTSELYGVTNWDFDFRGHKLHGDWQAALGVTLRVPHLSWMSMKGAAKRDYPASINYQSPWWQEYHMVEDHFARLNTALTRGKPLVRVGVIHPIESMWLHWGPEDTSQAAKERINGLFLNMTEWLLFGLVDFDFISEALLPSQCAQGSAPLQVGEMAYDAIIVPGCETLRSTTLDRLEAFKRAGGRLIFIGDAPALADARPSERGRELHAASIQVAADRSSLLAALAPVRVIDIHDANGIRTDNLIYQLRRDGNHQWLFMAHGRDPYNKDVCRYQDLLIKLQGCYYLEKYDTQTGTHTTLPAWQENDCTFARVRLYDYDSLLLYLTPGESILSAECMAAAARKALSVPEMVPFSLSEPNVLLLDQAEYALDDQPYQPRTELLRADNICRDVLGWRQRQDAFPQPWVIPDEPSKHQVHLRFTVHSEIELTGTQLAIEDAEKLTLQVNGEPISNEAVGWYVDRAIKCIALPALHAGKNTIEVTLPFSQRSDIEWAYLLGDFSVRVNGSRATITAPAREIGFGDICMQGLPFYGGNITYHVPFTSHGGHVNLQCPHYLGTLLKVQVDDGEAQHIIYPPYTADLGQLSAGKHIAHITLFGHRRNSFGPVHLADLKERWIGPNAWRSKDDRWSDSYQICREGLMSEPRIWEE